MSLYLKIILIIYITVSLIFNVGAQTEDPGEGLEDEQQPTLSQGALEFERNIEEAIRRSETASGHTTEIIPIDFPGGGQASVSGDVSTENGRITASHIESGGIPIQNGRGFSSTSEGFRVNSLDQLNQDGNILIGAEGVEYKNGILTAARANSFIKSKSITISINDLNSREDKFSVAKADSFLLECIRIDDIKDSEFKVNGVVEITTKSHVTLKITDCAYNEYTFYGKGRVSLDRSQNPKFVVENGSLTRNDINFNESIDSGNSSLIETDKNFGFECLIISPAGSYFYNNEDIRKSFVIHVPEEASNYKLCIRKNFAQKFKDYDGLVDFVDRKIELSKIVDYLRLPLKNNQASSLLNNFAYQGLQDVSANMFFDDNMIFINSIFIKNYWNLRSGILTATYPSNYHIVKEAELKKGIHRLIKINTNLNVHNLTQNVYINYKTDYFEPEISINDNVIIQDNGKNKITILPPEHPKIGSFPAN